MLCVLFLRRKLRTKFYKFLSVSEVVKILCPGHIHSLVSTQFVRLIILQEQ
jgi:hypothetical protein